MLCAQPWRPNGGSELPCGQCMPCRINKRNIWTTRILLELTCHESNSWITLTYNDDNIPYRNELDKTDYQLWLKRLRKAHATQKIRYYLCGEYGDDRGRPHYHVVLFGLGFNYTGTAATHDRHGRSNLDKPNFFPERIKQMLLIWGKGNIHFEKPNPKLVSYSCSHLTKGLAGEENEDGRKQAFHAMSNGLGKNAMSAIESWLSTEEGVKEYEKAGDVPAVVRIDGKIRPIGKYLRNIIRRNLYLPEKQTDVAIAKRSIERHQKLLDDPMVIEHQREKDRLKAQQLYKQSKQRRHLR